MRPAFYRPSTFAQWVDYRWRQFGTGLSFTIFGLAGVVVAPVVLPMMRFGSGGEAGLRRRVQGFVSGWFRVFSHIMRTVGVIDWRISGAEKLKKQGQMIIANHPSLIDVVLLLGYIPKVDCIVKQALFKNPFTHAPVTWAGYVSNSTPTQLVADCADRLRQGHSLLIFPEGTRTEPGEPIRIPHAAARIALESGAPVLPVSIKVEPLTLHKGLPWYRVPSKRAIWTIEVGEPERIDQFLSQAPNMAIAARRLSRHWEQDFSRRIGVPARD